MHSVAATIGAVLDRLVGEPPAPWHPVAAYGRLMQGVEARCYADRRINGAAFTAAGVGLAAGVGWSLRRVVGPNVATILATTVCVAGRMLDDEALRVSDFVSDGDLATARREVRSLVGRSTEGLDEAELSRSIIESVAENGVDAVTASLFWAAVGGAPGVLAHRAANTLDAMVGHHGDRYERFGWASARLDDMANLIPARLTALAVVLARPSRAGEIARIVRRDAGRHPSPNGGVVEAAFAAALGVRLGGANRYGGAVEQRGTLGDGPPPRPSDVARAVRLRRDATAWCAVGLVATDVAVAAVELAGRRRGRPVRWSWCGRSRR